VDGLQGSGDRRGELGERGVAALVETAQQGDEAAFTDLYRLYFEPVRRYLEMRLGTTEDALDLTQQAFVRVLERLPQYRPTAAPFRAWLFVLVKNLATDRLRKEGCVAVTDPHAMAELQEARLGGSATQAPSGSIDLGPLVQRLPAKQQRVLLLRYGGDFDPSEIADILGTSVDAVRHVHHRAMRSLSPRLTRPLDDCSQLSVMDPPVAAL
jgi:RNA polymerase sigma-70 factor (ECF subfamily)